MGKQSEQGQSVSPVEGEGQGLVSTTGLVGDVGVTYLPSLLLFPPGLQNMANKKLKRTGLPSDLCERLSKYQIINCQDFLSLSPLELMRFTGQSIQKVSALAKTVSKACAPKMVTALEMKAERCSKPSIAFFPTSLTKLDEVLHGGLACGTLTEVTGPSGCGKTQFCMMLSVLATLPVSMGGLDGAVIYIDTESAFSAERLIEIARCRFPNYFHEDQKLIAMTNRIHLYRELTCLDVLKRLESLEEDIILKGVKLIVVDSVASVVRKEFDTRLQGNLSERSNLLSSEAATLKFLAEEFSIPVVLTNQITTRLSQNFVPSSSASRSSLPEDCGISPDGETSYATAALGNTWSHSVNTRLIVQYLDYHRRQMIIAKSPLAPFAVFIFTIQKEGLVLRGEDPRPGLSAEGTDPGLQPIGVRSSFAYCPHWDLPGLSQAKP
ncbi:DNA repair protein RAD51 homolog 2 isoform X2 [Chiloscyllium plagiosum]|uniref:DNA repair protein RAD51 homolog 2 isoform X2 n=1 Tax=Chiloscyllium plagiosum TaxID=36176 RepID=UPI001CB8441D|nr:DNA repair protein RAD51 homolog 2 isoform X2 [Chiloscyllium plagiosum]